MKQTKPIYGSTDWPSVVNQDVTVQDMVKVLKRDSAKRRKQIEKCVVR